jgi:hypothetical protein
MKYFRIVREESDDGSYLEFRVQERGWFCWRDVRHIKDLNIHGPSLTYILRFSTIEEARKWIDDRRGRNECKKTVIETYGVYG